MRLLHPKTLGILYHRKDISKVYICRPWSEIFKWKASKQIHPKMFLENDIQVGSYLRMVYTYGVQRGCKLDKEKIRSLGISVEKNFTHPSYNSYIHLFDENYLFSDAVSLYLKNVNIFPDIFGDEWEKYVPIKSHKEMVRVLLKHVQK